MANRATKWLRRHYKLEHKHKRLVNLKVETLSGWPSGQDLGLGSLLPPKVSGSPFKKKSSQFQNLLSAINSFEA